MIRRIGLYSAYLSTLGGGENVLSVLAELLEQDFPTAEIDLITYDEYRVPLEALCHRFDVNLHRTRIRSLPPSPTTLLTRLYPIRRLLHERQIAAASADYDLFFNNTIFSLAPVRSRHSFYICMFPLDPRPSWLRAPSLVSRLLAPYGDLRRRLYRHWIGGYSQVLANSAFTQGWISRFWKLDSRLLYPPVATQDDISMADKRQVIIGVGRFFPRNHNKKHEILIEMMNRLQEEGLEGWELHLVGGRTPIDGTDSYIERLKRRAEGLPVFLHLDASRDRLEGFLKEGSLFWHATGFGENEETKPDSLEHFGLSTVEAMTFGCVPIVYAAGGQPEIVEHGKSGFLWRSLDELRDYSLQLIRDRSLRERMGHSAHERSQNFSRGAFRAAIRAILAEELQA